MVLRVKEAFSYDDPQGMPITMRVGVLLDDKDPRVRGHERYLEPAADAAARTTTSAVETATAVPGEKRPLEGVDEASSLRIKLEGLGVKVDGRWSVERLRQELDKAGG
jgi:hypothetical protein